MGLEGVGGGYEKVMCVRGRILVFYAHPATNAIYKQPTP